MEQFLLTPRIHSNSIFYETLNFFNFSHRITSKPRFEKSVNGLRQIYWKAPFRNDLSGALKRFWQNLKRETQTSK